ncbi:hypothetical protein SCANM63S_10327 [Streptomyces canarius]
MSHACRRGVAMRSVPSLSGQTSAYADSVRSAASRPRAVSSCLASSRSVRACREAGTLSVASASAAWRAGSVSRGSARATEPGRCRRSASSFIERGSGGDTASGRAASTCFRSSASRRWSHAARVDLPDFTDQCTSLRESPRFAPTGWAKRAVPYGLQAWRIRRVPQGRRRRFADRGAPGPSPGSSPTHPTEALRRSVLSCRAASTPSGRKGLRHLLKILGPVAAVPSGSPGQVLQKPSPLRASLICLPCASVVVTSS